MKHLIRFFAGIGWMIGILLCLLLIIPEAAIHRLAVSVSDFTAWCYSVAEKS